MAAPAGPTPGVQRSVDVWTRPETPSAIVARPSTAPADASPVTVTGFFQGHVDPLTWAPDLAKMDRRRSRAKTCVLAADGGVTNRFTFSDEILAPHERTRKGRGGGGDTRLYAFKSVRGSKLRDLFPTYEFPKNPPKPVEVVKKGRRGKRREREAEEIEDEAASVASEKSDYHLCQTSRHTPSVLDPGPWPTAAESPKWDVWRAAEPPLDPLDMPAAPGAPFDAPLALKATCPTVARHYMHVFESQPKKGQGMPWGELPRFRMLLNAHLVPKPQALEKKRSSGTLLSVLKKPVAPPTSNWKLETSIFAPRKKEADSRGFYNPDKFFKKMLAADWKRLKAMSRFENLLKRLGGPAADAALLGAIEPVYRGLLTAFDQYSIVTELDPFDISMSSWLEFADSAGLRGEDALTDQALQGIFIQVNVEVGQAKDLAKANDNNSLMRFEFIEAIIRVLGSLYDLEKRTWAAGEDPKPAIAAAVEAFERDHLSKLSDACRDDADAYRRDRLYNEACCDAFCAQKKLWNDVFNVMSNVKPDAGRPTYSMDRWLEFLEMIGLRTADTSLSECVSAFVLARMRFLDDTSFKYQLLDFVGFLEALARVVEATPVPTKAALEAVEKTTVAEFYEHVTTMISEIKTDGERDRVRGLLAEDPDQPLSDKLELMLPYLLVNAAVSTGGTYRTKAGNIRVGQFLTDKQKEKWTALAQIARPELQGVAKADSRPSALEKLKSAGRASLQGAKMMSALKMFGAGAKPADDKAD